MSAEQGPLDAVAGRRIAASTVAVVATADRDGERDVTVLAGPRCFLRVLDDHRFAWPEEGDEAVRAYRANLAESPQLAVLALAPGSDGSRAALHVNGTAEVVRADSLRTEHPDLPANPVPGQYTDVWVVVRVGDAYLLDGDDVPPVGLLGAAPPTTGGGPGPAPSRGRRFGTPVVAGLLAGLAAVLLVALVGTTLSSGGGGGPSAAAGVPAPAGPVVTRGRVVDVPDPSTVVVDVDGTPTRYGVVGLGAPAPPCAAAAALDFARTTLLGKTATLVPDPTLPPSDGPRAYVVLETQLSYTDAAITAGWAVPTGDAQYRAVFDREQTAARDARLGMWGPPCVP